MERDQSGEGEWRLKSALGTCARGPMINLLEDGEACCSFASLFCFVSCEEWNYEREKEGCETGKTRDGTAPRFISGGRAKMRKHAKREERCGLRLPASDEVRQRGLMDKYSSTKHELREEREKTKQW